MSDTLGLVSPIDTNDPKFKDFENVRGLYKTKRDLFIVELRKWQQDYTVKNLPYDYRQAKLDFEEEQEILFKKRKTGGAKTASDVKIDNFDFKKYSLPKRFKLEKETDVIENKLIDGIKVAVKTGIYQNWISTEGFARYAVFVPLEKLKNDKN